MSETPNLFSNDDMADAVAAKRAKAAPEEEEATGNELARQEMAEAAKELPAEGADAEPDEDLEPDPASGDHEEEGEPDESPVLAAPNSWPKDRLDEWNDLTSTAQELVLAREREAQTAISEKGREAAEVKRKAEETANRVTTEYQDRINKLNEMLPSLAANFKSRWEGVDWVKETQDDPDRAAVLKAQMEADQRQFNEAAAEAQQANAKTAAENNQRQYEELLTRNPQYAGEAGQKVLAAETAKVREFALSNGYTEEGLAKAGANDFEMLRDAMKFREANKTATKPAKKPAQKVAKPGARRSSTEVSKKIQSDAKAKLKTLANTGAGRNVQDRAMADLLAKRRTG